MLFPVIIACILPDLPWITLTLLLHTEIIDPYTLRLYTTIQASLAFCLILSGAIAPFFTHAAQVFIVLSGNCLFHLILDSLQIKWGNGVNFLAPVNWEMFHLDLSWPEAPLTILLTLAGFGWLLRCWSSLAASPPELRLPSSPNALIASACLILYLFGPLPFMKAADEADLYSINTLRHYEERTGKPIAFDRASFHVEDGSLTSFAGEHIVVTGAMPDRSGRVSFRGSFISPNIFHADQFHYHLDHRDLASLIGLVMACTLFLQSLLIKSKSRFLRPRWHKIKD